MNLQQLHDYTAKLLAGGIDPTLPVTSMHGSDLYELTHFVDITEEVDHPSGPEKPNKITYIDLAGQSIHRQRVLVFMRVGQRLNEYIDNYWLSSWRITDMAAPTTTSAPDTVADEAMTVKIKLLEKQLNDAVDVIGNQGVNIDQIIGMMETMAGKIDLCLPNHLRTLSPSAPKFTIVQDPKDRGKQS